MASSVGITSRLLRYMHYVQTHAVKSAVKAQQRKAEEWRQAIRSVDTNWIQG